MYQKYDRKKYNSRLLIDKLSSGLIHAACIAYIMALLHPTNFYTLLPQPPVIVC